MADGFQHPFRCIHLAGRHQNLLIGSAGSNIYSYSAVSGALLDYWPRNVCTESTAIKSLPKNNKPSKEKPASLSEGENPKASKPIREEQEDQSHRSWSVASISAVSSNGEYVIALTAEDKAIRVLSVGEDGTFHQLSARCMPKRPSAIVLTADDKNILCADKFGDVYSLPLIPSDDAVPNQKSIRQTRPSGPAASDLTVHTKRNLKSLKQQMQQLRELEKKEKPGPSFERRLLLGHVSLLTDLAIVPVEHSSGTRSYVLTADRDEHIRVSRGPPQTHVIENYCLGHTSFVSKLCIPRWSRELLVSGGGDRYLLIWKWIEGRVLEKVLLVGHSPENKELAVHGIWAVQLTDPDNPPKSLDMIFIAIEGSAQLQTYILESAGSLTPQASIQASGNILSVASNESEGTVFISVDCIREPGSIQTWRASPTSEQVLIEAFRIKPGTESLQWEPAATEVTATINRKGTSDIPVDVQEKLRKEMNESLYGLDNLRKKPTEEYG